MAKELGGLGNCFTTDFSGFETRVSPIELESPPSEDPPAGAIVLEDGSYLVDDEGNFIVMEAA